MIVPTLLAPRTASLHRLPPRLLCALAIDRARTASFATGPLAEGERTATRVARHATHDVWLLRWGPGSHTELHDHGGSAGAIHVVTGELVERVPSSPRGATMRRVLTERSHRALPPAIVHEVANESRSVAESIHVYSPPLDTMHHYEVHDRTGLRIARRELIVDD
jgi:hypothetical protein